jgi:glyoxylate/hydroxypyruvate reductase
LKVLLCGRFDEAEEANWLHALTAAAPDVQWLSLPAARATPADVVAAVVANPEPGSLRGFAGLRLIQSLWAGVNGLLADEQLPADVPICRMVDPVMNAAMAETTLWAVLSLHRGFFSYAHAQRAGVWRPHAQRRADEVQVLVLGQGQMGGTATARIRQQGYVVQGWRSGMALAPLLKTAAIVVNLLPLTQQTRGLLNAEFFAQLPAAASVVNLARGAHVVDADLLAALDSGHLQHAVLDVFHTEPLPASHPFWQHPKVTVLPHAAALTDERSAAQVVAKNLRALREGAPLAHRVSRQRGY